jgi:hypothetical protein
MFILLERAYKEYKKCKSDNEELSKKYVDNDIFKNAKVLTYQGP